MNSIQHGSAPAEYNCLVSFLDITGYQKQITPSMSSLQLFSFLQSMFEQIGEVVESAEGRVVKFIGDAALVIFSEKSSSNGIVVLKKLKEQIDSWLGEQGFSSQIIVRAHFGPVVAGFIGTKNEKRFDVLGDTVNTAATLKGGGFSISPQAFRCLSKEDRKMFKKHTPPIYYIPIEERHKDW